MTISPKTSASIVILVLLCAPLHAQWVKVPANKPNLSAPAPRTADGPPDLSGIWEPRGRYSTGKWDGDTLVIDTRGFNGKAWLDQLGKPTTDALHVIERFRRKDFGHMDIQITIDDPKAYTKPWTVTEEVHLLTNTEPLEFICNENNVDVKHLPGNPTR